MDNRENQEQKSFTPAAEPYVRPRRSAAARAAAMQAQQPAAPAAYMRPEQAAAEQTTAIRKRSAEQALTAPVVYEPAGRDLRMPSVKPVELKNEGKGFAARSKGRFIFISILLGVASGLFLLLLNDHNRLLFGSGVRSYGDVGMVAHCLIWGGVLGFVCALILSPIYRKLPSSMPIYAMLLFLPVLLYLLTPLMVQGTELVIALIGAAISLIGGAIGLFLVWTFLCGG